VIGPTVRCLLSQPSESDIWRYERFVFAILRPPVGGSSAGASLPKAFTQTVTAQGLKGLQSSSAAPRRPFARHGYVPSALSTLSATTDLRRPLYICIRPS
jgi:hypothetical protein